MRDRSRLFYILNGQEINRSFKCTPTRTDTRNVLTKSIIKLDVMDKIQITLQNFHHGYEKILSFIGPYHRNDLLF